MVSLSFYLQAKGADKNSAPVKPDPAQQQVIEQLDQILFEESKNRVGILHRISSFFGDDDAFGVYVHGAPGSGKSMISSAFAKCYNDNIGPVWIVHYHDFRKALHAELHELYQNNIENPLNVVAERLGKKYKLVYIDELEINDITDAMAISKLIKQLFAIGVDIVLTSNTAPENLYLHGLQRDGFLPFIAFIQKEFDIILCQTYDYRLKLFHNQDLASLRNTILYPASNTNLALLSQITQKMSQSSRRAMHLKIFGRDITFRNAYYDDCNGAEKVVLHESFDNLCKVNFSYNDYTTIAERIDGMIIDFIPRIESQNDNVALRFIYLVDALYYNKVMLVALFETDPEELYVGNKKEFSRAVSRIREMATSVYRAESKLMCAGQPI